VDELAVQAGLPVRTLREYQSMGLLPAPRREGRVGLYGPAHLARVELIGRLQARGYSLKGIDDLLRSWRDGADLGEVLGLAPDQLVHADEPGVAADPDELAGALPGLLPDRLDDLLGAGVLEEPSPGRYCVPSPSLLQLASDALAAGIDPDRVIALLGTIGGAASQVADAAMTALTAVPSSADPERVAVLAARGRGLLGHGTGRMAIHALGRRLGVEDGDPASTVQALLSGERT
jgi:DNA-binding transcriptional MerR regulator